MTQQTKMTHDDFIKIEWETSRALKAIGQFASPELCKTLKSAEYLLSELRSAAQWMCDPQTSEETKAAVLERLASVFEFKPYA